jgi:lysozyme
MGNPVFEHQVREGKATVSEHGLDFIKSFEGYVGHPYQDSVGVWTIGYGHTEGVTRNSARITEKQAAQLLADDLRDSYAAAVNERRYPFTEHHQFDMVVSFVYNLGVGMLDTSHTFGADMARHEFTAAAESMLMYDMAGGQVLPGLARRRQAEREVFLNGYPK